MSDLVKVNHILPPEPFRVVKGGQQVHLVVHDEDEGTSACLTMTDEEVLQLIGLLSEALMSKWGA